MQTLSFGTNQRGEAASLYVLENKNHAVIKVSDHGATLVSVLVPDKEGKLRDVVLGYDDAAEYDSHTCYFGATIGRNGNRIDNSELTIDGKVYKIPANENENSLHSGPNGFDRVVWEVKEYKENSITLYHLSTEEEQGFPGNLKVEVTYTLTDDNAVEISYRGEADKTTVMNFTNHSYFNLGGQESGSAAGQQLQILAEAYNPVRDSKSIPTGEIAPVEGTPMDFRQMKPIRQDIDADFQQLKYTGGYDHNYVLSDKAGEMKVMANAYCEETGIAMEASTDCCGVQFYSGNFITDHAGKGGAAYVKHSGFCLESQFYPNAVNQENFPSPIVEAGKVFTTKTIYRFYTK
ncbi:aldose epimerase family protein [Lachnospiraceae bacterium 29-84]